MVVTVCVNDLHIALVSEADLTIASQKSATPFVES
jgi:hypothetical protein